MTQVVPLQPVPSQSIDVVLGNQNTTINLYVKNPCMFADILVDGVPLVTSVMVHDGDPLVRYQYLGFSGDLVIVDTQGADDPLYMGLGDRWLLLYTPA